MERNTVVRIKKSWTGVAVAALALTTLAACGSDDDGSSTDDDGGAESADIRVWLNGTDTPQEARDWLKKTFEEDNPGSTLTIEQQEWDGLVEKLTTALSSESETPDVVEIGNTQAPTFTSAGAFAPLTDELDDLGGDDLLPGLRRGCDGRRRDVRRAVLRRLEVHLLPQGPLREGRPRGAHDARRVRRGRGHPEEGQPQAGQLLRLLVPRAGLAQRRGLRLVRRRRPGRRGRRRVDRIAVVARVRRGPGDARSSSSPRRRARPRTATRPTRGPRSAPARSA